MLAFAGRIDDDPGGLFENPLRERQQEVMHESIDKVSGALQLLRRVDPFGPDVKASDDFLDPVFQRYFDNLQLPNLMQKANYHLLVPFVPIDRIDPEISAKLDLIVEVASRAQPAA